MGNLCASYTIHPSITIKGKRYTIVKDIGEGGTGDNHAIYKNITKILNL